MAMLAPMRWSIVNRDARGVPFEAPREGHDDAVV
jgi:hypothetical protein